MNLMLYHLRPVLDGVSVAGGYGKISSVVAGTLLISVLFRTEWYL